MYDTGTGISFVPICGFEAGWWGCLIDYPFSPYFFKLQILSVPNKRQSSPQQHFTHTNNNLNSIQIKQTLQNCNSSILWPAATVLSGKITWVRELDAVRLKIWAHKPWNRQDPIVGKVTRLASPTILHFVTGLLK